MIVLGFSILGFVLGGIVGLVIGAVGSAKALVGLYEAREAALDKQRTRALEVFDRVSTDIAIQDVIGGEPRISITTDDLKALVDPLLGD